MMTKVTAEQVMGAIRQFAPHAVLTEEADGNICVALNMRYDMGLLVPFDNENGDDVE
jgi:hypothetical protein